MSVDEETQENKQVCSKSLAHNSTDMSNITFSSHVAIEAPTTFMCDVCEIALHFRRHYKPRCSICNQTCGNIQLTCDKCGLCICCNERDFLFAVMRAFYNEEKEEWKSSCYNSYFESSELVREQLYNRRVPVSLFYTDHQQRWLQCMWHDITQDEDRFYAELQHSTQVTAVSASNVSLVVQNLGLEMAKSLVRLFVIFQTKLNMETVQWFSSLIQYKQDSIWETALETSVKLNGRLEQVKWLVDGLQVDVSNYQLSNTLAIISELGRLEILEFMLEDTRVDPSVNHNCGIRFASENGHLNVVERLLQDDRVDPSADDNYAVRWASRNGHLSIVERLLQDVRVDPSANDNDAIRWARYNGSVDVLERLLQDDRVDPSANDNDAIQLVCFSGYLDIVDRLLQDDRVNPSANDNFAIRSASGNGHLEVVERLLLDDRVDPAADRCFAIRHAFRHVTTRPGLVKCLYDRTRLIACYMFGVTDLMKQLAPLHNESLMIGGLCLMQFTSNKPRFPTFIPQDVICTILWEWAVLVGDVNSDESDGSQSSSDESDGSQSSSDESDGSHSSSDESV